MKSGRLALLLVLSMPAAGTAQTVELALDLRDSVRGVSVDAAQAWMEAARQRIIRDRRDPAPRIDLGYLYLERAGAARMARTYFEEALRFDRKSAAAHVGLYWTERAEGRDAEAREHLERAIALAPAAEADLRRLPEGGSDLGHANPRRALRAAIDLLVAGDPDRGTAEYFRALERAGPAMLSDVFDELRAFFPEHQMEAALERAGGLRARAIVDLWMSRDPTPATPANEVLAEAYLRLDRVRRDFHSVRPPGYDERGRTWLRLGPPDQRKRWGGSILHPAESWLYERLAGRRVTLHFVRRGLEYVRVTSATEAIPASMRRELVDPAREDCRDQQQGGGSPGRRLDALTNEASMALLEISDFDPVYLAMAFCLETGFPITRGELATETFRLAEGATVAESAWAIEHAREGEPADFAARAVAFEDGRGGYDVWVVLGYPVGQLVAAGGTTVTVRRATALYNADWERVGGDEGAVRADALRLGPTDMLVDGLELRAPPGAYQLGVEVEAVESGRIGAYRFPLALDPPDPSRLRLSDVVLADRVLPGETGRFTRGGVRLVPSPTGVFRRDRPVALYFEIYPSREVPEEDVRVAVTVRSGRPESLPERIFGAIRGLVGTRQEPGSVTIEYERRIEGPGAIPESLSLDASALPAGVYEVVVEAGPASRSATLVLTE